MLFCVIARGAALLRVFPMTLQLYRFEGFEKCIACLSPPLTAPSHLKIYPHGSTDALPFATMGSGSLAAMAMFEAYYKDDMERGEAMALVARAIRCVNSWTYLNICRCLRRKRKELLVLVFVAGISSRRSLKGVLGPSSFVRVVVWKVL